MILRDDYFGMFSLKGSLNLICSAHSPAKHRALVGGDSFLNICINLNNDFFLLGLKIEENLSALPALELTHWSLGKLFN